MSQEGRNASLGTLIFNLSPSVKSLIRKVEKINEKVISASQGILFNECCIKEGLLPKYIYIHIYLNMHQSSVVIASPWKIVSPLALHII